MRLTKTGKIVFTIIVLLLAIICYVNAGTYDNLTASTLKTNLTILEWGYTLFIAPFCLFIIWE